MSDVEELCAAFGAGTLLHPGDGVASFVDLARAMASVCGAEGAELSPAGQELAGALGAREHLVLVLADGLGLAMIEDAEPEARFLRAHLAMELRAVFPASTAVALTTLATGEWPAQHAVTGWWTHLDEIGEAATILQFRRRSDERPLGELGVTAEAAFPVPSLLPRMQRETLCLMPRAIAGSVYSRYWSGGTPIEPYTSVADGLSQVIEAVRNAPGPSFTYLYAPHVDHAAHDRGPASRDVRDALRALDRLTGALTAELGDDTVVALTADHGHLGASHEQRQQIRPANGIPELLECSPAGDSRVLHFHVREGAEEAFAGRFRERFGRAFYLLTTDEVERLGLFGPDPLSGRTRARLGDFVAISRGAEVLGYQPAHGVREMMRHASHHAGLRPEELRVPLVLGSAP